ncbi:MAG TPA: uracil-DNA glycosylase [Ottowia sp.]|nr:uracil-DNA glycosylase [Ottowia sp.]HNJ45884.1 uracil-DNA glycosylase [Ottowia sp.]HNN35263.1 uracil-DNA glycosylase [Ottowia sp.]HNO43405.1 uracil-DNA glycosylase [Ottowia sp.]HNT86199.1 uracil-DNA glycosylase [Ottowia sp.]
MLNPAGQGAALGQWPCDLDEVAAGWRPLLQAFLASAEGRRLSEGLRARLAAGATIYPPQPLRALQLTPPEAVRAVILGQDPYHGPGQACGLAFAVAPGVRPPPSLRNIFKELAREFGRPPQTEQHALVHWARQGVLLLNTSLTVEAGQAASHARIGWQMLTSQIFHRLVHGPRPLAFLLWGAHAQALRPQGAEAGRHLWLVANHPSPLSALRPPVPFIGCGHFGRVNSFLRQQGEPEIDWLGTAAPAGPLSGPAV